jgi:hypothetical protein
MSDKKQTDSFVMHRRVMYESDAYRSLGKVEMKILARLEIELMSHRGTDNGHMICTYDDFAEYGIRYPSITPGLRKLSNVGPLHITQRGRMSATRNPHHYRLTYLPCHDEYGNKIAPTDEWKRYRAPPKKRRSKQKPRYENVSCTRHENVSRSGYENVPMQSENTGHENVPTLYNLSIFTPPQGEAEAGAAAADAACADCRPVEIDWPATAAASLNIPTFLLRGHPDCVLGDS